MKDKNGKDNVVSFPLQNRNDDVSHSLQNDNCRDLSVEEENPKRTALGWLGLILARLVFYPLLWLRPVVMFVAGLTGKGSMIAFFICLLVRPNRVDLLMILGGVSFTCFMLTWVYDSLVLALSPERMFLDSGRY